MTNERFNKIIGVIQHAIDNRISVKKASEKCGLSPTYVKNGKIEIIEKHERGLLEKGMYEKFMKKFDEYKEIIGNNTQTNTEKPVSDGGVKYTENGDTAEAIWETKGIGPYPKNHIKTLEDLLKAANVDLKLWQVTNHSVNKWDVTSWKTKKAETVQNFQVKASLKRIEQEFRARQVEDVYKKLLETYQPPTNLITAKFPHVSENNLLEVSIFDLHLGKLAWAGETGENYDTKIARERFMYSIKTLLNSAEKFTFNKILFPIGSDFFNSDSLHNTTTKGTPQDEDLRWQKTFDVGIELLIDGIELLKQTGAPIDIIIIPGNHDFQRSYYMGSCLKAWFKDDGMVNVDNGASPRKYYVFGDVLLGFTHGNEEKESALPLIMAKDTASKSLWSSTKFHEWHVGHKHRKSRVNYTILEKDVTLNEDLGVTIRYLSSLTGTEEWHHRKGYIGQLKAADAFIWNDKTGLVAHLNSNIIV